MKSRSILHIQNFAIMNIKQNKQDEVIPPFSAQSPRNKLHFYNNMDTLDTYLHVIVKSKFSIALYVNPFSFFLLKESILKISISRNNPIGSFKLATSTSKQNLVQANNTYIFKSKKRYTHFIE